MNHPDSHTTKQHAPPNQFVSAWKKLSSSQKGSVITLSVLALILPIAVLASRYQKNINSRAALQTQNVVTPPGKNLAIKFPNENGNNSYLVVSSPDSASFDLATGNPFTVEAWVKIPKPVSGNYLRNYTLMMLTKLQASTDYGYIYSLNLETQEATGTGTTRPMFSALKNTYDNNINSNYISVISNSEIKNSIPLNTWTHIAITSFSENQQCFLKLYLNGTFVDGAGNSAPNCQISTQQPQKLFIAKYPDGAGGIDGYYYPGAVDEMRISNIVRYTQNFTPPTTPFENDNNTVALWHFDQDTQDSSVHSLHFANVGTIGYINVEYPPPATPTAQPTGIEPSPSITGIPVTPSIIPTKVPSPTPVPTIFNHPPVITSTFLPKGQVNRPYNAIISGMDQDIGNTLQMDITNLPPGITKRQCQTTNAKAKYIRCLIKGIPTLAGIYPVNVKLTDNFGGVATKILSLTIINPNKFDEPQPKE